MSKSVPKCDFCNEPAKYDARIPFYASWGYVCEEHFVQYDCKLGIGHGSKLNSDGGKNGGKDL